MLLLWDKQYCLELKIILMTSIHHEFISPDQKVRQFVMKFIFPKIFWRAFLPMLSIFLKFTDYNLTTSLNNNQLNNLLLMMNNNLVVILFLFGINSHSFYLFIFFFLKSDFFFSFHQKKRELKKVKKVSIEKFSSFSHPFFIFWITFFLLTFLFLLFWIWRFWFW